MMTLLGDRLKPAALRSWSDLADRPTKIQITHKKLRKEPTQDGQEQLFVADRTRMDAPGPIKTSEDSDGPPFV